jgi:hypothetical protein
VKDVYDAKNESKQILEETYQNLKNDIYRRKQQYKMVQLCRMFD